MSLNFTKINNVAALGVLLAVFCAVSAAVMAFAAVNTRKPIEEKEVLNNQMAVKMVLPAFDNRPMNHPVVFKAADGVEVTFYGGLKDGKLVGIAAKTYSGLGYGGKIEATIGINPDGKIRTVNVTKHNETPGLGSVICDRKDTLTIFNVIGTDKKVKAEGLPPNRYLDWYNDKFLGEDTWKVKKDGGTVEYMTGATITSRAVADLANRALQTFLANRKAIIAQLTAPKSTVEVGK